MCFWFDGSVLVTADVVCNTALTTYFVVVVIFFNNFCSGNFVYPQNVMKHSVVVQWWKVIDFTENVIFCIFMLFENENSFTKRQPTSQQNYHCLPKGISSFFFTFPFCLCIVEGKNRVNRIIKQSWKKFAPTVFQGFNSNRIFSHLQKRNEKT